MTRYYVSDLQDRIEAEIIDNTEGLITPQQVRDLLLDTCDTMAVRAAEMDSVNLGVQLPEFGMTKVHWSSGEDSARGEILTDPFLNGEFIAQTSNFLHRVLVQIILMEAQPSVSYRLYQGETPIGQAWRGFESPRISFTTYLRPANGERFGLRASSGGTAMTLNIETGSIVAEILPTDAA